MKDNIFNKNTAKASVFIFAVLIIFVLIAIDDIFKLNLIP